MEAWHWLFITVFLVTVVATIVREERRLSRYLAHWVGSLLHPGREAGMRKEIPVVIRKSGERFIPEFPVELEVGDTLVVTRELTGFQVPEGEKWTVSGCTASGPLVEKHT